jgi:membrane protein DedA with SNARE-associated domain
LIKYIITDEAKAALADTIRSMLLDVNHIIQTGGLLAILLARFIVIVRTVIPLVAGIGKMNKRRFLFYNITGSILWTTAVILAAYWLGHRIPNLDKYLIVLVVAAMVITTGGGLIEAMRTKPRRAALKRALKDELRYLFKRKK